MNENIKYIDMHTFRADSELRKEFPILMKRPHGKNGWGYYVIDTSTTPMSFVGYIDIINYKTNISSDAKQIKEFFIDPIYRNQGIGNKLMQLAIARNAYVVCSSLDPEYEPDHINALHLYEKYGFTPKQNQKTYNKFVHLYRKENIN